MCYPQTNPTPVEFLKRETIHAPLYKEKNMCYYETREYPLVLNSHKQFTRTKPSLKMSQIYHGGSCCLPNVVHLARHVRHFHLTSHILLVGSLYANTSYIQTTFHLSPTPLTSEAQKVSKTQRKLIQNPGAFNLNYPKMFSY